jgi:hypothetical protein
MKSTGRELANDCPQIHRFEIALKCILRPVKRVKNT